MFNVAYIVTNMKQDTQSQGLPAQPNRSLLEGIDVLLAVATSSGPRGVRELART